MSTVVDQVKDFTYTSVGVNLVVADAVTAEVRKQRTHAFDRLGSMGERANELLDDIELETPESLEPHAKKARKQGKAALKDFRAWADPRAVKLEDRLPEPVAERVVSGRKQTWDFLGVKPKTTRKKTSAKKRSTKKTASKKAASAKKTVTETVDTAAEAITY